MQFVHLIFQEPHNNESKEQRISREKFFEKTIFQLKNHLNKKYINIQYLEKGGSAIVFSATKLPDNSSIAIKIIPCINIENWCSKMNLEKIPLEVDILEKLKDVPGIPVLVESYFDHVINSFIIVMKKPEWTQDLYEYINENLYLDDNISRGIMKQILTILKSMHDRRIHYRDLKDENIIIDLKTMQVSIIDFGYAMELNAEMNAEINSNSESNGTVVWSAPECFRKGVYDGMKALVWALGTLLYVMVTGSLPFNSKEEIINSEITFENPYIMKECKQLITSCLTKDPKLRITFEDLSNHPWILNQNQ